MPEIVEELIPEPEPVSECLDIAKVGSKLSSMLGDWAQVENRIDKGREDRANDKDIEAAKETGKLQKHERFINVRVIDANISRKKGAYLQYFSGPKNIVLFLDPESPGESFEDVADAFDNHMKYVNWLHPFHKAIDCTIAHAIGAVEVLFDENAPGRVSVEYVAKRDLLYDLNAENIQMEPYVMRRYQWTLPALKKNARDTAFNEDVVEDLINELKSHQCHSVDVFKVYLQDDDGVYIAWWSNKTASKWLKDPIPYTVGIDEREKIVPLFILPSDTTEDNRILSLKGECINAAPTQIAICSLWSALVSGSLLSANPVFSPVGLAETGSAKPVLLKAGQMIDRPVTMHALAYPPAHLADIANQLRSSNLQESGQVNYAAVTNTGSEKTATEINAAAQLASQLSSVAVSNLSNFIREVYNYAWRIVHAAAMNDEILLVGTRDAIGNPVNDKDRINRPFLILASGDREGVRREELKAALKELYPEMKGTALGRVMLGDIIQNTIPSMGSKYLRVYKQSIAAQDLTLQLLSSTLARASENGGVVQFSPEELQQLQQTYVGYQQAYGMAGTEDRPGAVANASGNTELPIPTQGQPSAIPVET